MDTEYTETISKQRRWQLKMKKLGLCTQCGKDSMGLSVCPSCSIKNRNNKRKAMGFKARVEGGRGRPQIY